MKAILLLAIGAVLSSCAGSQYVFKGMMDTPYGSVSSDGETVTVKPIIVTPTK